jgi:5'-nucleotidase
VAVSSLCFRDKALLNIDIRAYPWGTPYFWFGFERKLSTLVPGTDLAAIAENKISVTPLSVDLTDRNAVSAFASYLGESHTLRVAYNSDVAKVAGKTKSGRG